VDWGKDEVGFLHMEKGIQETAMILRKQRKQQTKRHSRIFEVCMQSKAKGIASKMLAKLQVVGCYVREEPVISCR
jgi:hypothetical protein